MSRSGPDENGLYDKDYVCRAFLENMRITLSEAHALVLDKAEVTVRNWLRRFAYEWETREAPEDCPGSTCVPKATRERWHRLRNQQSANEVRNG